MSIENIVPQEDTWGMQKYTWQPSYDGQNNITNANVIFSTLINVKKIKPSWENNGYLSWFSNARYDNWNYNNWWYEKRRWFQPCDNLSDAFINIVSDITDVEVIDWERYYMWSYENKDPDSPDFWKHWVTIRKQCWSSYKHWCTIDMLDCCAWTKIQVKDCDGKYVRYRPQCSYNKFLKTYWPKWKKLYASNDWILRAYRIWNTIVHMLYNPNWEPIQVQPWQYIYWYDSYNDDTPIWWYRSAKWQISHWWHNGIQLNWYVPWLISDLNWIQDWSFVEKKGLHYAIYSELWDTLSFVWDQWIIQIHDVECWSTSSDEYRCADMTVYGATYDPNDYKTITSLFNFWWSMWYISGNVLYMSSWWQNPWVFVDNIFTWGKYTDIVEQGNVWYLIWPNDFGIMYKLSYQNWTYEYRISHSNDWRWYFNPWSYYGFRWSFYQAVKNDDWSAELMTVYLNQQYDFWLGMYSYSVWYKTISDSFIQNIFASANTNEWDEIHFSNQWWELIITITDNISNSDEDLDNWLWWRCPDCDNQDWLRNERYTTMLRYDSLKSDWVTWYICNMNIKKYKHGCYIGNGIFVNEWNTDNWCPIKEVIWFTFWQINPDTQKLIDSIVYTIWWWSHIWSDTYFYHTISWSNYAYHKKEKWFFNIDYVDNILSQERLILSDKRDHKELNNVFKKMPLWHTLFWWNSFFTKDNEPKTRLLQRSFCCYNKHQYGVCIPCCPNDIDTECCDYTNNKYPNNMFDNEDFHAITLSKHWNIGIKINQLWEIWYFELIAWGTDNIQLFWYNIYFKWVNWIHPPAENWLWNQIC